MAGGSVPGPPLRQTHRAPASGHRETRGKAGALPRVQWLPDRWKPPPPLPYPALLPAVHAASPGPAARHRRLRCGLASRLYGYGEPGGGASWRGGDQFQFMLFAIELAQAGAGVGKADSLLHRAGGETSSIVGDFELEAAIAPRGAHDNVAGGRAGSDPMLHRVLHQWLENHARNRDLQTLRINFHFDAQAVGEAGTFDFEI